MKIFAVGNSFYGDDGVGMAVLDRIREENIFPGAELIDIYTDALSIIDHLEPGEQHVVVDAAQMGLEPGAVEGFQADEVGLKIKSDHLSMHGFGLAEAFAMARQLGRQFKTLTTMVEIDRAILSVLDTEKVVNTVLTRMGEVFPSKSVSMAVIDSNPGDTAQTYIREGKSDKVKPIEKVQINPEELQMLRKNPETLMIKKDENLPRYLAPMTKYGINSFQVSWAGVGLMQ